MCTRPMVGLYMVSSRRLRYDETLMLFEPTSEATITKDNPAFSMINDSDEEVVYGSDEESRRPLNSAHGKGNDYDSD